VTGTLLVRAERDQVGSTCRQREQRWSWENDMGTRFRGLLALAVATLVVAGALVVGFDAGSEQARADELKLTSGVTSGVQSVLARVRIWDANCNPLPVNVTITSPPLNGVASVKAGLSALPESTPRADSTGKCAGAIMIGKYITYRSNPGFHGLDSVSYDAVNANGKTVPTIITITVR
jgi:hypothetical protein